MIPRLKRGDGANSPKRNPRSTEDKTWLWLIALVVISVLLGWYPYFHDASYPLVGTDIYWYYVRPAQRILLSGTTFGQWLTAAAKEDHPLVAFVIAIASNFSGLMPELLLRYVYVFLILAFSGSIFVLVKFVSGSRTLASMSALVATVSPSTTVGTYTGIIANWLALIVWALSLAPLAIENVHSFRRRVLLTVGIGSGSVVVLFLHPWTWIAFVAGLIAYLFILLIRRRKVGLRDMALIVLVVLMNGIAVGLSLFHLSRVEGWTTAYGALTLIQRSIASKYLGLGSWEILVFFSQIWSQFLNPVVLALSILGVIALARRRDKLSWVVLAWIVAACATNVLAAPIGYYPLNVNRGGTLIWRAFFLTPFQIPVAIGILSVRDVLNERLGQSRGAKAVVAVLLLVLFLAILDGALRALFPLLTDPHSLSATPP